MKLESVQLHWISLPYCAPFETSFGRETEREAIIVQLSAEGVTAWGECVAGNGPWYTEETNGTAWHIINTFLLPILDGAELTHPSDIATLFAPVRGHPMARAALENAVWAWFAQKQEVSLQYAIGGQRSTVPVGVSIGIEPTLTQLLANVDRFVEQGYARLKLKIKPGWDIAPVRAVRERHPDILLQVDANSAYTLHHVPIFRELDQFQLRLIEQPLHQQDFVEHAQLQAQIKTPICLDESIQSYDHARWALLAQACQIINIKVGRVGGLTAALAIHNLCQEQGVPVWCGGMLETNIGRSLNLALASLPNFTLPGDISASARYFYRDIATPNFVLNSDSTITVPTDAGLGVVVDEDYLRTRTLHHIHHSFSALS